MNDWLTDWLINLVVRWLTQFDWLTFFCPDTTEKKRKPPPRQYPSQAPPPWIPKPEVSVVSVQPQDSAIKDDDDIPYSSSDEETITVMISCAF